MAKALVTIYRCIQDSQEFGSDDEHMVSRVFFTVESGGKQTSDFVQFKQTVGTSFFLGEAGIEVSPPQSQGPWNHEEFRSELQAYYHKLVGSQGLIRTERGSLRMWHNVFDVVHKFEIDVTGSDAAW